MDENRPTYKMHAPAAAYAEEVWRAPGREELDVDDHIDEPELTRWEQIGELRMEALPAKRDHAVQQVRLDRVIDSFVAAGYEAASDLKTRFDAESDFASDTAILRQGIDPTTGRRYLEEVAFEIVSHQQRSVATEKAKRMARRGVKRIFALFVKKGEVAEWSVTQERWITLHPSSSIEDKRLVEPVPVKALLEAAAADDAVASALVAKNNPVIRELRDKSKAEGKAQGASESILEVLEARGLKPSDLQSEQIRSITDLSVLKHWLRRAALVASVEALFEDVAP